MQREITDPEREIGEPGKARTYIVEEEWAPPDYRRNLANDLTDDEAVTAAKAIFESAVQRAVYEKSFIDAQNEH